MVCPPTLLRTQDAAAIQKVRDGLTRKRKPHDPDRIIAALNFGFWTSLLDRAYERQLWPRLLAQVFPSMPRTLRTRQRLASRFNQIRRLRNRVFHHEPIWHWRDLPQQPAEILEAIRWLEPALEELADLIERFATVHTTGPKQIEQQLLMNFSTRNACAFFGFWVSATAEHPSLFLFFGPSPADPGARRHGRFLWAAHGVLCYRDTLADLRSAENGEFAPANFAGLAISAAGQHLPPVAPSGLAVGLPLVVTSSIKLAMPAYPFSSSHCRASIWSILAAVGLLRALARRPESRHPKIGDQGLRDRPAPVGPAVYPPRCLDAVNVMAFV